MKIHRLTVGPFHTNCYIIQINEHCFIVDPGGDVDRIINKIYHLRCTPLAIVATHAHFDHILGAKPLKERFNIPFWMHREDLPVLLAQPAFVKHFWGIELPDTIDSVDRFLDEGDALNTGVKVIHTPGHSPGSITLAGDGFLIVGDVIFKDGYGRTDLPGGNESLLFRSISRILSYPDNTSVLPGHGEVTTVGYLRKITDLW